MEKELVPNANKHKLAQGEDTDSLRVIGYCAIDKTTLNKWEQQRAERIQKLHFEYGNLRVEN